MNKTMLGALMVFGGMVGCDGGSTSPSEAMQEIFQVSCEKAHECRSSFPDVGISFEGFYGTSASTCVTNLSMLIDIPGVEASISAGRIVYNEADAEICLDTINLDSLTCEQYWGNEFEEPAACDTAFVGTVANGGTCTHDLDCAGVDVSCEEGVCG